MVMFKNYISWYTQAYRNEDSFIRRKAEYTAFLMHYLIIAVAFIICLELIFVEASSYVIISGIAAFLLFGSILLILRMKRLSLAINIMIFSGFIRLLMIYFYPTPFQFYVLSMVCIVIVAVIHTHKNQVRVMTTGILIMMLAKVPIFYFMVQRGEIHWRAVTQSGYATVFLLIFIQMTNFLVKIINDEISKTQLLQDSAYTDHLTGLKNRRQFWEIQSTSHEMTDKYSIILFDVDHFKRINDSLGHDAGDLVLIELASIVKKQVENRGHIFRWGGEEFLILIPHSDKKYAKRLSEKLRKSVESTVMPINKTITISIGIEDSLRSNNVEEVISRADQAMYKAKKSGRNRICELTA